MSPDLNEDYEKLIITRDQEVCGVGRWHWLAADNGAWDGPHNEFEPLRELIIRHRRGSGAIVQAGGCLGMYPRLWADWFQTVYTFEPDPLNFYVLKKNVEETPNVIATCAALGNSNEPVFVHRLSEVNVGMHRIVAQSDNGPRATQIRIDDLNLQSCDAISLDCEGYESNILDGARETLIKFKPVISTETVDELARAIFLEHGYEEVGRVVSDTVWVARA